MKIHIVREGETLWTLAKTYNVPTSRLLEVNPKLSEKKKLEWGSKVRIPTGKVPVIQTQAETEKKPQPSSVLHKQDAYEEKEQTEKADCAPCAEEFPYEYAGANPYGTPSYPYPQSYISYYPYPILGPPMPTPYPIRPPHPWHMPYPVMPPPPYRPGYESSIYESSSVMRER